MTRVYQVNDDGSSTEIQSLRCDNEDLELQRILERNPSLIPGEQINPINPRRWLVVKREMPVPDPSTGIDRWSIDLFLVDQDGMPTFVECKRYKDTRAKREVVGQMLEYAANGHHYWSKEDMMQYAMEAARNNSVDLDEAIKQLRAEEFSSPDEFFQRVEDNLREGQVRLVFFMEEAPSELKSVVDFLNKQMERSEVLLVEARQYECQGIRIVNPLLFGFSEQARMIKKTVTVSSSQERRKWDHDSFFQDTKDKLEESGYQAIRRVYEKALSSGGQISWGTGKTAGSFSVSWPSYGKPSFFTMYSNGNLTINFGNFGEDDKYAEVLFFLRTLLNQTLGLTAPSDTTGRYPTYKIEAWGARASEFEVMLDSLERAL